MLRVVVLSILFYLCSLNLSSANEVDFEGLLYIRLYHSLSNEHDAVFSERGNISIHGGSSIVTNIPLSHYEKTKLQTLAAEDKFYRLKAIVTNNDKTETEFLTSVKACMLALSSLSDYVTVSLDHTGNVVGISIGVTSSAACQGANVPFDNLDKFNTKVFVNSVSAGAVPDTASYIQKLEREREAKERGDVKDNRSFLAKYWMYIVPVVILMVLSSATNPDGAGPPARQS